MNTYRTNGTCSRSIDFEVIDRKISKVAFNGGCSGNSQGISRLIEGLDIDEVIEKLRGVKCRNGTSCPDQLARALSDYKMKNNL